jgi:NAD(P)-dependent dehydrogenase (short-subunit alcohol dehydrogenase family)
VTNDQQKEETMKAQRIEGAVALVTGANRGIGRALTEAPSERQFAAMTAAVLSGSAA